MAFSAPASPTESGPIQLRCWGVYGFGGDRHIDAVSMRESFRAFHAAYPHIQVTSSRTMLMPASGGGVQDTMVPLMQIAGGIPEDVLYVDFARSDAYIRMKLLYPLDEYVEDLAGFSVRDGHLMDAESYFARLTGGPNGSEIDTRVPRLCYEVMFRLCPYAVTCPHLDARGLPPAPEQILLRSTPSNRGLKTPFPTTKQNRSWPTRIPERSRQDGSLHLCRRAIVAPPSGRSGACPGPARGGHDASLDPRALAMQLSVSLKGRFQRVSRGKCSCLPKSDFLSMESPIPVLPT